MESKTKIKDVVIDPKKDLYKQLSKKVDRYRQLPKIKASGSNVPNNDSHNAYHSIDYGSRAKF